MYINFMIGTTNKCLLSETIAIIPKLVVFPLYYSNIFKPVKLVRKEI